MTMQISDSMIWKNVENSLILKNICALAILINSSYSYADNFAVHSFPQDGYSIEVPYSWQERTLSSPAGGIMRAFVDSNKKLGAGYCQVEIMKVDKNKTPLIAGASSKQLREYFSRRFDLEDWLMIFPNLASAANFQLLNSYPSEVGGLIPAEAMEFRFSVPNGYFYRTRTHVAVSNLQIYSLWCVTVGHDAKDVDNNFRSYLPVFQIVAGRFKPFIK